MTAPVLSARYPAQPDAVAPGARHALLLLVLINLFNYIDRQVLAAVEPQVARDFFGNAAADDTFLFGLFTAKSEGFLMGLLSSAFLVTYMFAAPVFGWMSTWVSRWLLIGAGVLLWSLASGASGLATGYTVMLLTRCLVGIGEAIYGPVAPDIISDLYPVKRRGQILSWFYAAIPFGGALGYALGDLITRQYGDWRIAFYAVVPPGVALAVWCWFMREPIRGLHEGVGPMMHSTPSAPATLQPEEDRTSNLANTNIQREPGEFAEANESWRLTPATPSSIGQGSANLPNMKQLTAPRKQRLSDYLFLLSIPSYALNTAGMTFMVFAMGGMAFWMPRYLEWLDVPPLAGVPPKTVFGGLTALSGLAATLIGGWAGDRLRDRFPGSYFLVSGAAMVVAFPLLLLTINLPFPLAWLPLVGFVFCLFFNTGPTNTILANVTHPQLRAPGFALNILIIHLLGDVISPPIMGAIKDYADLKYSFYAVSVTVLIGGILWLWGSLYLQRDTQLAPTRLPAD